MLAVGDNSTAIMAALPAMARELDLGHDAIQWVVNAYLLASASFIVLGGESADRFGSGRSSIAGILLFALASLLIALAPDAAIVIVARALQGLGAAFAVAGTLAAVNAAAPPSERASAIGSWSGFLMLGFSIGPLVGGLLTDYAGWRANFWINLLLMALAAAGLLSARPVSVRRASSEQAWPDWRGLFLLGLFMTALTYTVRALPSLASAPWRVVGAGLVAIAALLVLLKVERSRPAPLVDFSFFARPAFAVGAALLFVSMFNIMTLLLYYNLFAQSGAGLGYSAIAAGLSLLPLSLALIGFARAAPRLAASLGLARVMLAGMAVTALGCLLVRTGLAGQGALLSAGLFVTGAGIALAYASAPRLGLAALSQSQSGQGSGMLNSCSFLGGTLGVTCGGIAFTWARFDGVLAVVSVSALLGGAVCTLARRSERSSPQSG